jgi:hypothetical protein
MTRVSEAANGVSIEDEGREKTKEKEYVVEHSLPAGQLLSLGFGTRAAQQEVSFTSQ